MNEKEKENVKEEEEEEEEEGIWVREKRKRKRSRRRREEQLADRLDLAPASDGGQWQRQQAEVRGQTSVIFLFFFPLLACRSRVGAVSKPCRRSEKKKKKRRDTRWTPESGESYPYRCPTRVRHQHDAKNGVSVQPRRCLGAIRILFQ